MRHVHFLLAATALLASLGTAAAAAGPRVEEPFQVIGQRVISPGGFVPKTAPAALSVPLTLIVQADSEWLRGSTLAGVLGKASAIFSRCGVTLGPASIVTVRWSDAALHALDDQDPYHGPAQLSVMGATQLPAGRPLGFLFGPGSIPPVAEAFNRTAVGHLLAAGFSGSQRLRSTFWITSDWNGIGPHPDIAPSFSVFAHELAHILGDLGHVTFAPNLMTTADPPGSKTGDLTDDQCRAIRRLDVGP